MRDWLTLDEKRELEAKKIRRAYREGYDNALAEQHVEIERLRARLSLAERSIQELKADRAEVIEECERKLEAMHGMFNGFEAAAAIRALKDS